MPSALAYDAPIVAKRIGELLVEAGVLSQSQLEQALFAQRKDGRKLGQLLVELGLVSEIQLTQTLSRQLSVPWVSLYHVDFSRSLLNLVPREAAEKYCLVPIFVRRVRKQGETLYVAMDDPTNEAAIEDVARAAALPVKPMIACPSDIRAAIRVYYLGETAARRPAPGVRAADHPLAPASPPAAAPPSATQLGPRAAPPAAPAIAPIARPSRVRSSRPPRGSRWRRRPTRTRPRRQPRPGEHHLRGRAAVAQAHAPADVLADPARRDDDLDPGARQEAALEARRDRRRPTRPAADAVSDQLTARDLVSALRAVAHGVDASEILGTEPRWEAIFSALLSILLRKGLIADWEFIEEFRKV